MIIKIKIRFKDFQEINYNPTWLTDDGSYMIGCEPIGSKLINGRCYKCDVLMEVYAERGVIGVSYRASLLNIVEDVNESDDDPFM